MNTLLKLLVIPLLFISIFSMGVSSSVYAAKGDAGTAPTSNKGDAGTVPSSGGNTIKNPLGDGNDNLIKFIDTLIDAALKLGAVVAVLAIIYAGFLFVTASGDEKKISTAKSVLLYAVIGIAILLGARALSTIIVNTVESVGKSAT